MLQQLRLVEPSLTWQAAFLEMSVEFAAAGENRYQAALANFPAYISRLQLFADGANLPDGYVPETTYWSVEETTIIGCVRVRHHLNARLRLIGGHIGYEIRPSKRRKGYGTRLLALALEEARCLGLQQVLITCDIDNIGSARIIEKNGGRLAEQGTVVGYDKAISRYWIELSEGS